MKLKFDWFLCGLGLATVLAWLAPDPAEGSGGAPAPDGVGRTMGSAGDDAGRGGRHGRE